MSQARAKSAKRVLNPSGDTSTAVSGSTTLPPIQNGPNGMFEPLGLGPVVHDGDPGAPGPFLVCKEFEEYAFFKKTVPGVARLKMFISCAPVSSLVIIFPAALSTDYGGYYLLGRHLARHGFYVALVTNTFVSEDIGVTLQEVIHHLYTDPVSPLLGKMTDRVALIGHSAGGGAVIRNLEFVRHPKLNLPNVKARQLSAVILMAPSFPKDNFDFDDYIPYSKKFDDNTPAFLGLAVVNDEDSNAYGRKDLPQKPMTSIFLVYDSMGASSPSAHTSPVEKDTVFVNVAEKVGDPPSHYFQNRTFCLAYITAFLHVHVNGNSKHKSLLMRQVMPPSLKNSSDVIQQQHDERNKITLMDCDHLDEMFEHISTSPFGVKVFKGGFDPWTLDARYPNSTRCLTVAWDRTQGNAKTAQSFFRMRFEPQVLSGYAYLTFRAGQIFPLDSLDPGIALDIELIINGVKTRLSDSSTKIAVPTKKSVFDSMDLQVHDATKNTLKTCLIPLAAFGFPKQASEITFDLTLNGQRKAVLYLDNVAFWKPSRSRAGIA